MNLSVFSLERSGGWQRLIALSIALLLSAIGLSFLIISNDVRVAVAVTITVLLVILSTIDIRIAVTATFVYLFFMGDIRRLLIPVAGWSGTDPLLLISPGFVILTVAYLMATQRTSFTTSLSPWVLGVMLIMTVQIVNPRQGSLMVGVAGSMFYLVPMLWFWIGQSFFNKLLYNKFIFKILLPLCFLSCIFGFYQTFYGYLPHQQIWYECCAYTALGVDGIQAPISFFASSIEYSVFNTVGAIILWARYLKTSDRLALAGILPLLTASFLMGSRGPVLIFTVVAASLWAAQGRDRKTWIVRGAFALLIGGGALGMGVSGLSQTIVTENARIQHRVQRQAHGLLNPGESTAVVHSMMFLHGIKKGFTDPLGSGLGSTTRASKKFGTGGPGGSEKDISDMFIATGIVGGTVYLLLVFKTIFTTIRYWHNDRSLNALCIAGILGISLFGWLGGGRYALTPLIWITVGALDRNASPLIQSPLLVGDSKS
jgi:hypothetical protein